MSGMADVRSPWSSYAQGCSPHHRLRDARLTRHYCPPPFNASSGTTASACATPCGKWGSRGGVLHYAPHLRPQPINQPNELISAACFMNDSSAALCCFGGCSGHGRCSQGLCVCAPGWRGLDCAEDARTADGASSSDSGCAAPGFVYVFDPPPSLGLEHMARRQYLGSLYDNEPHFLRKLLAAKCVRTTDPARARLFYVPTFAYALWGNVADALQDQWTMGRLAAWLHNQPAFRGLLHSTDDGGMAAALSRLMFFFSADRGACFAAQLDRPRPTFLVNFGLQVPMTRFSIPETYTGCKNSPRCSVKRSEQPCFVPGRDVPLPPYHAWTPLSDLPARSRSAWLCELFFAGQKRAWWGQQYRGMTYSQGVRQAAFAHYANRTGWCVSRWVTKVLSVQRWQRSRFCLAPTGGGFGDRLTQAMRYGCVPLIIQPNVTQPLEDILPYETFSLRVGLDDVPRLPEILGAVSRSQHASLLRGVRHYSPLFNWHTTHGQAFDAVAYTLCRRANRPACGHLAPLALRSSFLNLSS